MPKSADGRLTTLQAAARAAGRRPTVREAAIAAKGDGLTLGAFLRWLPHSPAYRTTQGEARSSTELRAMVSRLGASPSRRSILEFGADGAPISSSLLDDGADVEVTFVTRSLATAEAIAAFGGPANLRVLQESAGLPTSRQFGLIVIGGPSGPRAGDRGDGNGSEVVADALPLLSDDGMLVWVTSVAVLTNKRSIECRERWEADGLRLQAMIDLPPGWQPAATLEGIALVFGRGGPARKLVGVLRREGSGAAAAEALLNGTDVDAVGDLQWTPAGDLRRHAEVERRRASDRAMPKGRFRRVPLGDLMPRDGWERATRAPSTPRTYLFIPEYATSVVTLRMEQQRVRPEAVWRVAVADDRVSPAFLVRVLNSSFGRALREAASKGATIMRVDPTALLEARVPLPDIQVQERMLRLHADMAALNATVADKLASLDEDWTGLDEAADEVQAMKRVFDLDRRMDEWWKELPFPLATIHRRRQVSSDPKERFDAALHFFEVFAAYLAAVGVSHVRALRAGADEVVGKLLHPSRTSSLRRTDFGFWARIADGSLKELARTLGDGGLRAAATASVGRPLVAAADAVAPLQHAVALFKTPRDLRNKLKGHGGLLKAADAERADGQLGTVLRELYAASWPILRRTRLVRVGRCDVRRGRSIYDADVLQGSDPIFDRRTIETRRPLETGSLALWHGDGEEVVGDFPFFRLGTPRNPTESTMYVYNRADDEGLRWVSYQEATDQEIVMGDEIVDGLIQPPQ